MKKLLLALLLLPTPAFAQTQPLPCPGSVVLTYAGGYTVTVNCSTDGTTPPPLPGGTNVALASNGAVASASSVINSSYPAIALNNGDRKGSSWSSGGGWNDATLGVFPDWAQIGFASAQPITEIDVFTLQDNYGSPVDPTPTMTFSQYGITAFQVQTWDGTGWVTVPGGDVTGNNLVWRKFTFPAITTDRVRVNVTNGLGGYSRITEIEAWK